MHHCFRWVLLHFQERDPPLDKILSPIEDDKRTKLTVWAETGLSGDLTERHHID